MKNAIAKYRAPFLALIGTIVLGLVVGGYILSNQRFYLPHWVPVIGTDFVDYNAEFTTAQAVSPGQGQTVNIAGVPVGEIATVKLIDGRAVVGMKIRRKYAHIYKDATAQLRPKTGLNDMVVQLNPGTERAGEIKQGGTIPISQTTPNVNLDQVLSAVDGDTRDYLRLLIAGAGQGVKGEGKTLSSALRRLAPLNRDLRRATELLSQRRRNISRGVTNFGLLMDAVGSKDRELTQLISSSNAALGAFARQDRRIQEALRELPSTLQETDRALQQTAQLARKLGPTAGKLRVGARALGPAQRRMRPFLRETTPIIRDQVRPLARDTQPVVRLLRPTADDLAATAPDLTATIKTLNYVFNMVSYKPGGSEEGFGYYFAWLNHIGPQVFSGQDAHGPIRRGALLFTCDTIATAEAAASGNPALQAVLQLANPPSVKVSSQGDRKCDMYAKRSTGALGR